VPQLTQYFLPNRVLTNLGVAGSAGGSSAVDGLTSTGVSMANYTGCLFLAHVTHGGTGGGVSFSVNQATAVGATGTLLASSTSTIAAGSSATSESFIVDIYRPRMPSDNTFLVGNISTASSCAVGHVVFAFRYHPRMSNASTEADTVPATTASARGITGGVLRLVSPST
jgi:hypothetical protein